MSEREITILLDIQERMGRIELSNAEIRNEIDLLRTDLTIATSRQNSQINTSKKK